MNPSDLHGLAVSAHADLLKLSAGLAQAGVPPDTVKGIHDMADVVQHLIVALGPGQEQGAAPAGPLQAQPPGQGLPPAPGPSQQPDTIAGATAHLHSQTLAH